ncbi:MAG: hypothetical protein AAF533_24090 [Acidobacteriota bacterium]
MRLSRDLLLVLLVGGLATGSAQATSSGAVILDREIGVNHAKSIHSGTGGLTVTGFTALGDRFAWEITWSDLTLDGSVLREGRLSLGDDLVDFGSTLTSDGSLVVAWWEQELFPGPETGDVHVTCLGPDRELRWSYSYDSGAASTDVLDRARLVTELPGGDLLVIGQSDANLLLLRLSAEDGALLSTRSYELSFGAVTVAVTETDEILVGGGTSSDAALLSLSPSLDLNWLRRYELEGDHPVRQVVARAEGGALLVGTTPDDLFGWQDAWAMAVDAVGVIEWQFAYGRVEFEEFSSAVQLPDGGFVLAGWTTDTALSRPDAWLLALEPGGAVRWETAHGTDRTERGKSLVRLDDGRLVVVADTNQVGGTSEWDPIVSFIEPTGWLPEGCELSRTLTSQSAQLTMVVVAETPAEVPVTVRRLEHELLLSDAPSSPIVPCWESTAPEPPSEVSPPGAVVPLRVDAGSVVSWEDGALSSSTSFNLHRGVLGELAAGGSASCLEFGLTSSSTVDAELPSVSEGWYYLVAGVNEGGEGPVGNDSRGDVRATPGACP